MKNLFYSVVIFSFILGLAYSNPAKAKTSQKAESTKPLITSAQTSNLTDNCWHEVTMFNAILDKSQSSDEDFNRGYIYLKLENGNNQLMTFDKANYYLAALNLLRNSERVSYCNGSISASWENVGHLLNN